ncbi:hypothetical protein BEK98_44735 [Streptomyces diastatochromogenes]|uniref:TfoX N-terminal domain-containing protein n=1 Tax=Streptomyces diastatochromogenes TaxID=42236 RepID=A0A233RSM5_STRDA|nr:TfoX/Sxy family protein [Streptomyces diastatochromogenes]OXY86392.1 hypothetical protein BEK98_44735 [Streptomyces diastatochromogenes]
MRRERLGTDPDITEKRMFGGIAFLHRGSIAVGVIGDGLMVRVGPEATEEALARPGTRIFDMTGRPTRGWVVAAGTAVAEDAMLGEWIDGGPRLRGKPAAQLRTPLPCETLCQSVPEPSGHRAPGHTGSHHRPATE